ncbi:DUF1963 domain-containing protein, partial [Photobacterium damselae]
NSVTEIGESAFKNNTLTSVNIPNSVTEIGESAFENNALTSVNIPNSVTKIRSQAFYGNALTSVTIPNPVTKIGKGAFENNALGKKARYVTLPGKKSFDAFYQNLYPEAIFEYPISFDDYCKSSGNDNLLECFNIFFADELSYLRESYIKIDAIPFIDLAHLNDPMPFSQSKFGGLPFWPKDRDYPKDSNEYCCLIAQINFSEIPPNKLLPDSGLLQVFSDPCCCDFTVKFHSKDDLQKEYISNFDFLCGVYDDNVIPVPHQLKFIPSIDNRIYNDVNSNRFNASDELRESFEYLEGWLEDNDMHDELEKISGDCETKMFGYGFYINDDPKDDDDILLLQIEVDLADSGVLNLMISPWDLYNRNFENAYVLASCY